MRTRKKKCTEPWPNRYRDLQSHTSGIIVGECWRYCTCLAVSFPSLEVMKYMWTNHCATVGQRLPGKFEVSGTSAAFYRWHTPTYQITLLRVIPTMTFIHFLTGKSSGILSDISSGILWNHQPVMESRLPMDPMELLAPCDWTRRHLPSTSGSPRICPNWPGIRCEH